MCVRAACRQAEMESNTEPRPRHVLLRDQCQYFVPALFRNAALRPALERWFRKEPSTRQQYVGIFKRVAGWLFGSLAPHLERRVASFLAAHHLGDFSPARFDADAKQAPLHVCAQNRFPQGAGWWTRCIQKLSENRSGAQIFAATIESGAQFHAEVHRRRKGSL